MSSVIISGDSSGAITVSAPAVAGTNTLTLQAATATNAVNTLGTAVSTTSGTSIDFTGLPSWIKRITVMFNGVSLSATANILFQLGVGSTPTTTGYQSGQVYVLIGGGGTNGSSSTSGFIVQSGAAAYTLNGSMVFTQLNSSSYIWTGAGVFYNQTSVPLITSASGVVTLSGSVGMVRVTSTSTDTFDAGSINLLYE